MRHGLSFVSADERAEICLDKCGLAIARFADAHSAPNSDIVLISCVLQRDCGLPLHRYNTQYGLRMVADCG